MVAGAPQSNLIHAPAVSPSVTQSLESATPSATPCASALSDSSTDETLTVANGAMFRMPPLSVLRGSADEPGRLIMIAPRCARNSARYHLKTVALNSIARKQAIKDNATTVSVTRLRTDFVICVPPLPRSGTLRPFRCQYRPPWFHDSRVTPPTNPGHNHFSPRISLNTQ